jgi:hypothetical protein
METFRIKTTNLIGNFLKLMCREYVNIKVFLEYIGISPDMVSYDRV